MTVDEKTRYAIGQEAIRHCEALWQWWPGIQAKDPSALEHAGTYLDFLAADNAMMLNIVMKMLERQTGVNWASIRDAK